MLTDAEYGLVMRNKSTLEQAIAGLEKDEDEYDSLKKKAHDRKVALEAERTFFTNFLSDAIAEYEEAHPQEE